MEARAREMAEAENPSLAEDGKVSSALLSSVSLSGVSSWDSFVAALDEGEEGEVIIVVAGGGGCSEEYGLIFLARQTARVMMRIEKIRKRAIEPGTRYGDPRGP